MARSTLTLGHFSMTDRNRPTEIKSFVIGLMILVMVLGGVAFTPRFIFVAVPLVIGVGLAMGVLKSCLDDRATKTTHRLL